MLLSLDFCSSFFWLNIFNWWHTVNSILSYIVNNKIHEIFKAELLLNRFQWLYPLEESLKLLNNCRAAHLIQNCCCKFITSIFIFAEEQFSDLCLELAGLLFFCGKVLMFLVWYLISFVVDAVDNSFFPFSQEHAFNRTFVIEIKQSIDEATHGNDTSNLVETAHKGLGGQSNHLVGIISIVVLEIHP